MKTPKREQYYRTQKAAVYEDSESVCPNHTAYEHARWKRKNREKQLKRTIAKYKNGEHLFHKKSHLRSAYLSIQQLGELEQTASLAECRGHLLLVEGIIKTLRWEQEKALRYIEIHIDNNRKENQQ